MNFLKRHPFPVLAKFDKVVALSFAFPQEILQPLVPGGLEIDSYEGFGFVTAAMVWTKNLRPAGFSAALGQDFFLAGYRIFTRLHDESGRRLRGLKILRSETEKQRMVILGNLMTGYNYRRINLQIDQHGRETRVQTSLPGGRITADILFDDHSPGAELPAGSPFPDWRTARRFAGPMPFTFSPEKDGSFVVIDGSRQQWTPKPIAVKNWQISLFDEKPFQGITPILANAFAVEDVDYRWERGRMIQPKGRQFSELPNPID